MPEMTSKEAVPILTARAEWAEKWAREFTGTTDGSYYADHAAALRLAVGALERDGRICRRCGKAWRCRVAGDNVRSGECGAFEEIKNG
jgi:hypothetical protein